MDGPTLQLIARETLGVALTEAEAASLVQPYLALQEMIRAIEAIALPYTEEPFTSPGKADEWLESWPDK
jgi:hypothetical protein